MFLNTIMSINLKINNSTESKKSSVKYQSSGMHDKKKTDVLPSSEVCGVTARVG